jgi:NADH-quinone oxidoreductase subunit C
MIMADIEVLSAQIREHCSALLCNDVQIAAGEITIEVQPESIRKISLMLRDPPDFDFKLLVDVCGVDYLHYGISEWETESATATGFSRGVDDTLIDHPPVSDHPRFAAVYHLLSIKHNHRIRVRAFLDAKQPVIDSVIEIWPAANWFEREAFDLFGIIFTGHPDLRRILTDYGFIGHPFRKDFPLSGHVEVRYDAKLRQVVYEPVSVKPRILEPKVIRHDNRYRTKG